MRLGRSFCSLLRTPATTLRIEVSRDGFAFARSCSAVGDHRDLLSWFFRDDGRFSALSNDAGFTLGVGLERPSTCRVAFGFKYWSWRNLQIQVREAAFPCHLRRVSKGS